jgi:hypothetical protein
MTRAKTHLIKARADALHKNGWKRAEECTAYFNNNAKQRATERNELSKKIDEGIVITELIYTKKNEIYEKDLTLRMLKANQDPSPELKKFIAEKEKELQKLKDTVPKPINVEDLRQQLKKNERQCREARKHYFNEMSKSYMERRHATTHQEVLDQHNRCHNKDSCCICLVPFNESSESTRRTPCCMNEFHRGCLAKATYSNSSCPLCRSNSTWW